MPSISPALKYTRNSSAAAEKITGRLSYECISYRRGRLYRSHTVKALLQEGHKVVVIDNLSRGHRAAVPEEIPFYVVDIHDIDACAGFLKT